MPDNPTPAAKTEANAEAVEFNFANSASEEPRIRRRSLKTKQPGLIKPTGAVPTTARELEREAPPLSAEQAQKAVSHPSEVKETPVIRTETAAKPTEAAAAPPRTTPAVSPATSASAPRTAIASTAYPTATATSAPPKTTPASTSTTAPKTASPHGTRPATLYYSSNTRKEKEATAPTAPMKTIPTASTASPSSSSATTQPSAATRPAASSATAIPTSVTRPATAAARPSTTSDYRANIDRQSREQKSVGSILSYVVYGLIAFFVIGAALAGYGGYVLSERIHDQSVTVSDIDSRYAAANKDLNAKLAATQDALTQAQAQISRQNDLIVKQQDDLNRIIAATNDLTKALASEKSMRAQENSSLRARVRDLEYEKPVTH